MMGSTEIVVPNMKGACALESHNVKDARLASCPFCNPASAEVYPPWPSTFATKRNITHVLFSGGRALSSRELLVLVGRCRPWQAATMSSLDRLGELDEMMDIVGFRSKLTDPAITAWTRSTGIRGIR